MTDDRDERCTDILSGLATYFDSPFAADIAATASRHQEPDLGHALNPNQIASKRWLADALAAAAGGHFGTVTVLGGWFGVLPAILQGVDDLFGAQSPAALIVQAVLLHQSLNVVPEWPNPGSLSEAELALHIRPALLPLLEAMMLVDSDAWQLFDPTSKAKFRHSTLAVFAAVRRGVAS